MTSLSQMHHNYEEVMAHDPFGAEDSFRFWLHGKFVVLGTLIAVGLRASLLGLLKQVAYAAAAWLFCWRDRLQQLNPSAGSAYIGDDDYFRTGAWECACKRLNTDPQRWRAQAFALARLLFFHLLQPIVYMAIFLTYSPVLRQISPLFGVMDFLVLLREVVYAGFTLWTYVKYCAFMLFSLKHADRFDQLVYIITPDKMMILGIRNQHDGCCLPLTALSLFLFALDVASGVGLAIGLTAQVLEPAIVAVWSLTGASGVLLIFGCFLENLGCRP
eukprot:Skav214291  [mRNA]  locus=scaffold2257:261238:262056:+ [translate_table: standard]